MLAVGELLMIMILLPVPGIIFSMIEGESGKEEERPGTNPEDTLEIKEDEKRGHWAEERYWEKTALLDKVQDLNFKTY